MARTLITAQAQNADDIGNLDFNGFATEDNITQVLVQHRIVQDDRNNGVGNSFTAFGEIIKGDGVNGKIYDIYPGSFAEAGTRPRTDTSLTGESVVFNGVSQANVSEIFSYLNAGGSNVKHTRFTYSMIAFSVWKTIYTGNEFVFPSAYPGTEYDRRFNDGGVSSYCVDIYWGKYVKFSKVAYSATYDFLDTKQVQALYSDVGILPIDELSGEINLAAMIGFPYVISAPINSVYSEREVNSSSSVFYRSDSEGAVEAYTAPMINLGTRKITGLPIGLREGSLHGHKFIDHNWTIETDDFATTVTAPTPQEEVSGTKISELSSTTTLQDDDRLVISRDEGSDGSFDTSYNVSLSNLAAKMINDMPVTSNGWSSGWVDTDGTNSVANGATLTFTHDLGTTDIVTQYYVADDQSGTNAKEIVEWARTDFADNPQWYEGGVAITSISLNSISITIAEDGFGFIGAQGYHAGVNASGKYIKIVALKL